MDINPAGLLFSSQRATRESGKSAKRLPYTPARGINIIPPGIAPDSGDYLHLKSKLSQRQDTFKKNPSDQENNISIWEESSFPIPSDQLERREMKAVSRLPRHGTRVYPISRDGNFEPAHPRGCWRGINNPIMALDSRGRKVVFKQNLPGVFQGIIHPNMQACRDAREVVASRIIADFFHLPTVIYHEAYHIDKDGRRYDGIICSYIPGLSTLKEFPPARIQNPREAVQLYILRCWLGDWDQQINDSNFWVDKKGSLVGGDYGFALCHGVELFWKTPANQVIQQTFFRESYILPLTTKIMNLDDSEIRDMVRQCGEELYYWNETWEDEFTHTLICNREKLKTIDFLSLSATDKQKDERPRLYPPILFTPEYALGCQLGHARLITDPMRAIIGAVHIPVVAGVLYELEEKGILEENRERYCHDWLQREKQRQEKQSIRKIIGKIPSPLTTLTSPPDPDKNGKK